MLRFKLSKRPSKRTSTQPSQRSSMTAQHDGMHALPGLDGKNHLVKLTKGQVVALPYDSSQALDDQTR